MLFDLVRRGFLQSLGDDTFHVPPCHTVILKSTEEFVILVDGLVCKLLVMDFQVWRIIVYLFTYWDFNYSLGASDS